MKEQINKLLNQIKTRQPLILNITNQVTMNFIANGLLSLGAAPIMSQASEEMEDLMGITDALVINIGTLNPSFIELCHAACTAAMRLNKPIILDPVGVGASAFRTKTCLDLLEQFNFAIIRGNASEIMALSGGIQKTKGVESTMQTQDAIEQAKHLASYHKLLVVVSGATDAIVDSTQVQCSRHGSPLMPKITGSGCLLTSVIAAFHAVEANAFDAASAAVVFYGICGERAETKTQTPGSFAVHFLDALSVFVG